MPMGRCNLGLSELHAFVGKFSHCGGVVFCYNNVEYVFIFSYFLFVPGFSNLLYFISALSWTKCLSCFSVAPELPNNVCMANPQFSYSEILECKEQRDN